MKITISVVTFPLLRAARTPLSNLIKILSAVSNQVYLVSGGEALTNLQHYDNVHVENVSHKKSDKLPLRIFYYFCTQFKILNSVIKLAGKTDVFFFFIGGEILFIPLIFLKLLKKKTVLLPAMAVAKIYRAKKDPLYAFVSVFFIIVSRLSSRIIVYSRVLIKDLNITKYKHKILVAHRHFLDLKKFNIKKPIEDRSNVIGYFGRLSEEKGVMNLLRAIPAMLAERKNVSFLIAGEGNLAKEIHEILETKNLGDYVKLIRWITHDKIPIYLNESKLIILPSYTEGLPNIALEAMACGTPVLATTVGAIPDIIQEGVTGFLLKSNDPQHISKRICEIIVDSALLKKISSNAHDYVQENFSYETTLANWRRILSTLQSD